MIWFYSSNGFNIFLFNYRGYGRSQGYPTIPALISDGKEILDYIVDSDWFDKNSKLVVHGHSLGGAIASHASNNRVDFLFLDRTYSNIYATAEFMVGKKLATCFKILTLNKLS